MDAQLPTADEWGYATVDIEPHRLIEWVSDEASSPISNFEVLVVGPEPCNDAPGYCRVSAEIPLTEELADALMNGRTGYRAHYYASVELGERLNRSLVEAVAPQIIARPDLYSDLFDTEFCAASLIGRHSKFWYPKSLTDPSAQDSLLGLPEVIRTSRWREYWRTQLPPRKGLLAPMSENCAVLLNGTFIDKQRVEYEQKPGRSSHIFDRGWT